MALNVHSLCGYPSVGAFKTAGHKVDGHWEGYNMVKCAKGEDFNGYSDITFSGVTFHIDKKSRASAIDLFGSWGASRLASMELEKVVLVPIPSSKQTTLGGDCTAKMLADAVAKHSGKCAVQHTLAFKEAREADHGKKETATTEKPRRQTKDEIFKNLQSDELPKKGSRIVLVDDVCTQGFHLLAAADYLRQRGMVVEDALCVGRTIWKPVDNILAMAPEDLEASLFAFLDDITQ